MEIKDYCMGIQHVGIPTNDIRKSLEFYERLGFSLVYRTMNGNEDVAFLKLHDLVIEIYENKTAVMQTGAIDHIALDVKDIDNLFELVKKGGFTILDEQVNGLPFWEKGVKFFTILGPNNEKIEFCEKIK